MNQQFLVVFGNKWIEKNFAAQIHPASQVPGVMNARQPPCLEGAWIRPDGICTPNCQEGYAPNHASFTCSLLWKSGFVASKGQFVLFAKIFVNRIFFVSSWHFNSRTFGELRLLFLTTPRGLRSCVLSAPFFVQVHQMVPICCHWAIPALLFGWMKLQWMSLATDQRITNLPPLPQHLILGFCEVAKAQRFFFQEQTFYFWKVEKYRRT